MNIRAQMEPLTRFMPMDTLISRFAVPLKFLPEEPQYVIPCTAISGDGLVLSKILFVTERYISELLLTRPSIDFDITAKDTVHNFKFAIWDHEVKEGDKLKNVYQVAHIVLTHDLEFRTDLTYAGNERDAWIENVIQAIPIPLVLKTRI